MKIKFSKIRRKKISFGKKNRAKSSIEGIWESTANILINKGLDYFRTLESKAPDFLGSGTIWLESIIGYFNSAISEFSKKISSGVAEYKKAVEKSFQKKRALTHLTMLKDESELIEPDQLEEIEDNKVIFVESKVPPKVILDGIHIPKYQASTKPSRFKIIEFNRNLNEEIDETAHALAKPYRDNFQHLEKPAFPEAILAENVTPNTFNILYYFKTISLLSYIIAVAIGIIIEAIIWNITGKNVMHLGDINSILLAFGTMVVVFTLVLLFFKKIELYIRTTARVPMILKMAVAVASIVILSFGVLSAFHTNKKEEIKKAERLTTQLSKKQYQAFLEPENQELKQEIADLQEQIKAIDQKPEPLLIEILRYVALSLFGMSLLLCSIILKIVIMLGGKVVYLRFMADKYSKQADILKRDYEVWYKKLEDAYVLRNELIYLVCKKHACEQLLLQDPDDKDFNL